MQCMMRSSRRLPLQQLSLQILCMICAFHARSKLKANCAYAPTGPLPDELAMLQGVI